MAKTNNWADNIAFSNFAMALHRYANTLLTAKSPWKR
jgi:hypothetical protein